MIYAFLTAILFIAVILGGGAMFAVGLLLVILIPGSFHTVDAGTVAVVRQMGVIADVEGPGTYFDFYLVRRYEKYDAKVQQVEINMEAYTSDAQSMEISMVVQFQIRQDKVEDIALRLRFRSIRLKNL